MAEKNIGASVRSKLKNIAQAENKVFNLILTRYALERFLYRLSVSDHRDHFLLKGALLFDIWFDQPHRPTRDIDLLGFGSSELADVIAIFREVCTIAHEDGMMFDPRTVQASEIRKEANYAGVRVTLLGKLGGARCSVQIDVGYGDTVTPAPEQINYPVLLDDMDAPVLRSYPSYTVVAEKYQAMVSLGMVNTRLKDYFDLWVLRKSLKFDEWILREAISATFARRGTSLPENLPMGLSDGFAQDAAKARQWSAFVNKNKFDAPTLEVVVAELRSWLWG